MYRVHDPSEGLLVSGESTPINGNGQAIIRNLTYTLTHSVDQADQRFLPWMGKIRRLVAVNDGQPRGDCLAEYRANIIRPYQKRKKPLNNPCPGRGK